MTVEPEFVRKLRKDLESRGVVFDGTSSGLNIVYDSATGTFVGFRALQTDRIPADDPRLVDKLTAQCLHLLEYE